jgi:hypothetical protein
MPVCSMYLLVDTIASAAFKYISALADVTSLLGSFPSSDTINAGQPYLFAEDIGITIEGTSAIAMVVHDMGTYTSAPDLSTWQAFRFGVTIWVDPARDSAGNVTASAITTQTRGKAVWGQLNFHLHRTNPDTQQWGDMVTTSSRLLTGPQWFPTSDTGPTGQTMAVGMSSHPQVATAYYGVTVFGYTDAVS